MFERNKLVLLKVISPHPNSWKSLALLDELGSFRSVISDFTSRLTRLPSLTDIELNSSPCKRLETPSFARQDLAMLSWRQKTHLDRILKSCARLSRIMECLQVQTDEPERNLIFVWSSQYDALQVALREVLTSTDAAILTLCDS